MVGSKVTHVAGESNIHTKFTGLNTIGKSLIVDNGTNFKFAYSKKTCKGKVLNLLLNLLLN
jgi:hypothetical protein